VVPSEVGDERRLGRIGERLTVHASQPATAALSRISGVLRAIDEQETHMLSGLKLLKTV